MIDALLFYIVFNLRIHTARVRLKNPEKLNRQYLLAIQVWSWSKRCQLGILDLSHYNLLCLQQLFGAC